ncbi:ABC transporter permease, partial [candidate division KSB1 bacterium]|nr:ABC transporter permease [candidate division KSB1 bacterium]
MLKNTVKIALRNIFRQKVYSLLNIVGLAVGISVFLLISLYVASELTFDAFHKDSNAIFRIVTEHDNGTDRYAKCPEPIADMCSHSTHITATARFSAIFGIVVKAKDELFLERNAAYADAAFFDVFTIPFAEGTKRRALDNPDQIILSRATAIKYFGDTDVLGESIGIEDKQWMISAVYEDIPSNSHLPELTMLLPYSAKIPPQNPWDEWVPTYIKIAKKDLADEIVRWLDTRIQHSQPSAENYPYTHHLQPVRDIHLGEHYIADYLKSGDKKQLFIFASIATLILLVACLNFVNLFTAQSTGRWKEIGVRKVIGALQSHLMKQLLSELSIIILLAIFLAFFIVEVSHPWFNQLMGTNVKLSLLDPFLWSIFLAIFLFISLVAGLYPSIRLASFQPAKILWNQQLFGAGRKLNVHSILVICQFIVSIVLIIGSFVIFEQMNYLNTKELGFKTDRMLVIPTQTQKMAQQLRTDFKTIKQKFLQHHNVESVTMHLASPGRTWRMEWPT